MAGPLPFVDTAPQIEQRGSVVILKIASGDTIQSFALTFHAARMMMETARRRLDEIDRTRCGLIEMPPAAPAKPRQRKPAEGTKA